MANIFISYRRDDAEGFAGRIYDQLSAHFSPDKVFMDTDTITIGDSFPETIQRQLQRCDALIAVIGRRWLDICTADGTKRLFDSKDWVRHEIATALQKNILVVPVLVGGAHLPKASELPQDIEALTLRQAWEIGSQGFQQKVTQMIVLLEKAIASGEASRKQSEINRKRAEAAARIAAYKANRFPLKPFQYPLWVLFFCSAIIMSAAMSVIFFPRYLPAATALRAAYNSYQRGDIDNAIDFYQRVLLVDESSKDAKLGLAMALFKKGPDYDQQALDALSGLTLNKTEWEHLLLVMPPQYRSRFKERGK
ncbi:MAG: TIR domain-containing protein [Verrucomicrobia bacterium]|nr:TIR domain-containing protein [Verrucomicrobiota bacterium]